MTKPILDIIITHHDEPLEVGIPAFSMLRQQRLINPNDVHIIIVEDRKQSTINWDKFLADFPFPYDLITIPNKGVAANRNAGIDASTAQYMMFMDFDDMFSDVFSLCSILDVLPTDNYDILWMPYTEERMSHGSRSVFTNKENTPTITAKIFRSELIKSKHLRFDTRLQYYEDSLFYLCVTHEISAKRYGKISVGFVFPFLKTYTEHSRTHDPDKKLYVRRLSDLCMRGMYFIEFLEKRKKKLVPYIADVIFENYFINNRKPSPETLYPNEFMPVKQAFREFYLKYKKFFKEVKKEDYEFAFNNTKYVINDMDRKSSNVYGIDPGTVLTNISVSKWLDTIEKETDKLLPARTKRAAVYSGTRNVYENMLISAKSLIANSNVDDVFFLIEDDTFPYHLPECIHVMNVSNQQYFPESSPNYDNVWSYMCLMRAAFPKLFPQYDRILSLDIDIIVKENISELWDIDLTDAYIAGVQETDTKPGHPYVNFGVIMMNLDKLRNDHKDDEIIHTINSTRYAYPEQDPFNLFCDGHILTIDPVYNNTIYSHITPDTDNPKIIHYASIKNYIIFEPFQTYKNMPNEKVMELNDACRSRRMPSKTDGKDENE